MCRKRPFDSLRARMVLVVLVAMLPAAAWSIHDFLHHRAQVMQRITLDAEHMRDQILSAHSGVVESSRQLLAALARVPALRQRSERASELLRALKAEHAVYLNLFANRPDGTVFASATPLPPGVDSAETAWFRSAAASDGFVVGEYRKGKITGQDVLILAHAVRDENGALLAVIGASLPLAWFDQVRHERSRGGTVTLLADDGSLLGHFGTPDGPRHAMPKHVGPQPVAEPGTRWIETGDHAWVYAYAPLIRTARGRHVLMAFGVPAGPALAAADAVFAADFLKWISIVAFTLAGAWLGSRLFIEKPLRRLLQVTRRLAAGELSARSAITRAPAELRELSSHFDTMAAALQRREAELARVATDNDRRRREAEARSAAYQRELHAVMQRMQDVVFRLDGTGRLVWATPSLEQQSGYELSEVLGLDVCRCMADPGDKARMLADLDANGGVLRDWEFRMRHKDGSHRYVSMNALRIDSPEHGPDCVEGVARDITEQVRAREELLGFNRRLEERVKERTVALERINSELEAFTYSVSHDLRAPLRGIEGFSRLMVMRYRAHLPEPGRDYLDRVQQASRRMAQLIDDLLSLSRINQYELKLFPVDLSAMAREILAELYGRDPERNVEIRIRGGITCYCDRRLSRLALENLLANAWKYTGTRCPARIEVDVEYDAEGRPVVVVRDNGVGFDMRYADKLFTPFQRLHAADEFDGNGIGLATVMRVAQRHGGAVWADSTPDHGATFYIRLDAAAPAALIA